ncbi:MAG: polyprenyl synthetase family protein [Nitrospirae bacterium]|nr:polyprenyl synthetase family protein [Nitrospirota bacterium]
MKLHERPTNSISDVWDIYKEDLKKVEAQIIEDLDSEVSLINDVGYHLLKGGGKRFRPLLMILCSRLCDYQGADDIVLASVVEFIHTATLLHDDVVDEADVRRGQPAARSIWGNQASILVGDYLYSKALYKAVTLRNQEVNEILSTTTKKMAEGEILQLSKTADINITEEEYLKIIDSKTATLIAATCRLSGVISEASEEKKDSLARFGWDIGMAFQLADDTLDYTANKERLGKTLGKDLSEGKITLPLLHLLKNCNETEQPIIHRIIKEGGVGHNDLEFIHSLFRKYNSINYSLTKAKGYIKAAKQELACYEDSIAKQSLIAVANYAITRDL